VKIVPVDELIVEIRRRSQQMKKLMSLMLGLGLLLGTTAVFAQDTPPPKKEKKAKKDKSKKTTDTTKAK